MSIPANSTTGSKQSNLITSSIEPRIVGLSIVTATLNASAHLPKLIASLRSQSDKDFEWIVIDGASNDGTVALLEDARDVVSVLVSEPDQGIYDALNKGIKLASSDYYLVVGADDYLFANSIADFRRHAIETNADIVTAGIRVSGQDVFAKSGSSWLHGMFAYVSGHSVGTLINRRLHDSFGNYSRRFQVAADMYFLKRVCQDPMTVIERAGFIAGEHGNEGISSVDKAATFCDCFRVQLETERGKLLQILIFVAKILWRAPLLIAASRRKDQLANRQRSQ